MAFWEDDECEEDFDGYDDLRLSLGEDFMTLDGLKAQLMYHLTINNQLIYFGHVYEMINGESYPIAIQWFSTGKVDPLLYDEGYTIVGSWSEPKRYIRYVYLYREQGAIKTGVGDNVPAHCLRVKKVVL